MILIKTLIFFLFSVFIFNPVHSEGIRDRFKGEKKLLYSVNFNGIPAGKIEWEYLGQEKVNGKTIDIIFVHSDTNILKLLDFKSKEKIFLDSKTYLPIRVERDVVLSGKKEIITESYDQENGYIKIRNSKSENHEKTIHQDTPIHNILSLLYFFPQNIKLEIGKTLFFNLPTQKIKIKIKSSTNLTFQNERRETYFLVGRGAKSFNLWLDKENRLPLRLEFILPLGKINILRELQTRIHANLTWRYADFPLKAGSR